MGASDVAGARRGRAAARRPRFRVDHETGLALLDASTGRRCARPGCATSAEVLARRARLPPDVHERGRAQGAPTGHVCMVGPVRGLLGVHARPRDHDHRHQPRAGRRAALRRIGRRLVGIVSLGLAAVGRYSLAIPIDLYPQRREEMEQGRPRRGPRRAPGRASTRKPTTAASCCHGRRARGPGRQGGPRPAATSSSRWTARTCRPCASSTAPSGGGAPGESLEPAGPARRGDPRGRGRCRRPRRVLLSRHDPEGRPHRPPVLRAAARDVLTDEIAPRELQRLIDDMVETMHEYDGVGLAGPQVHVGLRVAVLEVPELRRREREAVPLTAIVNPELTPVGKEMVPGWEGCLSVPDLRGIVPARTRVRAEGPRPRGRSPSPRGRRASSRACSSTSATTSTAASTSTACATSPRSPTCRSWSATARPRTSSAELSASLRSSGRGPGRTQPGRG